jgi:hypothetical protein
LGFGKTEIFLQMGLDSQLTELLSDLPDGHCRTSAGATTGKVGASIGFGRW